MIRAKSLAEGINASRASRCSSTSCARRPRMRRTRTPSMWRRRYETSPTAWPSTAARARTPTCSHRETTVPLEARLVVFDTRRCPESELRLVMFQIMEYVTTTVERHWKAHKPAAGEAGCAAVPGWSIMLIDEASHLISRPETGAYANNLARRARHLGLVLIVMSQQLSDFDTEHGVALLGNSSQQLLLAQNPKEHPFIADTVQLSEREAGELARLKTVKGRHAQMLWLNGTRGHGKVALRVGPTEYWAYTSDPTEVAIREAEIDRHHGNVWAAIAAGETRHPRAPRPTA